MTDYGRRWDEERRALLDTVANVDSLLVQLESKIYKLERQFHTVEDALVEAKSDPRIGTQRAQKLEELFRIVFLQHQSVYCREAQLLVDWLIADGRVDHEQGTD